MTQSTILLIILPITVLVIMIVYVATMILVIRKHPDKVKSIEEKESKREPPCHKYALYCIKYDGSNHLDIKDFFESYTDATDSIVDVFDGYMEIFPMVPDDNGGKHRISGEIRIDVGKYVVVTTDKVLIKSEEELSTYFDLKKGNKNEV